MGDIGVNTYGDASVSLSPGNRQLNALTLRYRRALFGVTRIT